jgi:hypothetical protein
LACFVGLHQFDNQTSFFHDSEGTILSQVRRAEALLGTKLCRKALVLLRCLHKEIKPNNGCDDFQGVGYGIVVGFGAFFALVCSLLAWFDVTFVGHRDTSEHFQTASRNIKTGLIAGMHS